MVTEEDPEVPLPWNTPKYPYIYRTVPPEEELRANRTASAQHKTDKKAKKTAGETGDGGDKGNPFPDTVNVSGDGQC